MGGQGKSPSPGVKLLRRGEELPSVEDTAQKAMQQVTAKKLPAQEFDRAATEPAESTTEQQEATTRPQLETVPVPTLQERMDQRVETASATFQQVVVDAAKKSIQAQLPKSEKTKRSKKPRRDDQAPKEVPIYQGDTTPEFEEFDSKEMQMIDEDIRQQKVFQLMDEVIELAQAGDPGQATRLGELLADLKFDTFDEFYAALE